MKLVVVKQYLLVEDVKLPQNMIAVVVVAKNSSSLLRGLQVLGPLVIPVVSQLQVVVVLVVMFLYYELFVEM